MRRRDFLLLLGLAAVILYTLFYVQNRVMVPVRLTFDQPKAYLLSLVVLVSIIIGTILGYTFALAFRAKALANQDINPAPDDLSRTANSKENKQ